MLKAIQSRWVMGVILIGLGIAIASSIVKAQDMKPNQQKNSRDYYFSLEVESGIVGAFAGGFVGAITGAVIGSYIRGASCGSVLWEFSGLSCVTNYLMIGYLIGNTLGGIYGVVRLGGLPHRLRGNLILATVGAISGETLALTILGFVPGIHGLLLIPGLTALGAAIGYNF